MKTEAEIRELLAAPLKEGPEYISLDTMIPMAVAYEYTLAFVRKVILEDIPKDVHLNYCSLHKKAYWAKEGHNIGCPQCPEHDIWEPEEKT